MNKISRKCDDCTSCCEGWLSANIYGKPVFPGRPCHFLTERGCSIYEERPKVACEDYNCQWLVDIEVPHWMKPKLSKAILTMRKSKKGLQYIEIIECGVKLDSSVLSWALNYYGGKKINILYKINGGDNYIGSHEFIEEMSNG